MKGLLKNNFLTVWANAKIFSIFMLILGIFVVAVRSQSFQIGYVMIGIVGFSASAMIVVKNEFISKWGKYKLTLPVKRADIVKSYFINQIIWLLVGTLFAFLNAKNIDSPYQLFPGQNSKLSRHLTVRP